MSSSIRHVGRAVLQGSGKAAKGRDAAAKPLAKDPPQPRQPARRLSVAADGPATAAEAVRRSEESLRTVMFLSFWGPNA